MRKYRFENHVSDAKFKAYGDTLEEAFRNAALALISLMWDHAAVEHRIDFRVKVTGRDKKQLLVAFLEEILFLLDAKKFLLAEVEDLRINRGEKAYELQALFRGDAYSEKVQTYGNVKAVTYHEMKIEHNGQFRIQVVVDL